MHHAHEGLRPPPQSRGLHGRYGQPRLHLLLLLLLRLLMRRGSVSETASSSSQRHAPVAAAPFTALQHERLQSVSAESYFYYFFLHYFQTVSFTKECSFELNRFFFFYFFHHCFKPTREEKLFWNDLTHTHIHVHVCSPGRSLLSQSQTGCCFRAYLDLSFHENRADDWLNVSNVLLML